MRSPNKYERLGTVIDPSVRKKRPTEFYFSFAALIISLVAAAFTGWQAVEAHKSRIRAEESDRQQAREREMDRDEHRIELRAEEKRTDAAHRIASESAEAAKVSAESAADLARVARESLDVAKKQSEAAVRAADLADSQLRQRQANFKFENRAIVVFDAIRFTLSPQGKAQFTLTLRNQGKTRALLFYKTCSLDIDGQRVGKPRVDRDPNALHFARFTWGCEADIDDTQVRQIRTGERRLKVQGEVHHQDAWGERKTSQFCFVFKKDAPPTTVEACPPLQGLFSDLPRHDRRPWPLFWSSIKTSKYDCDLSARIAWSWTTYNSYEEAAETATGAIGYDN